MQYLLLLSALALLIRGTTPACVQGNFGESSFVCVCDASQCDYLPGPSPAIQAGQFRVTKASSAEFRLDEEVLEIADNNQVQAEFNVDVDSTKQYQTMLGWGGAFTDSTGINLLSVSAGNQANIMRSYFGPDGLDYNLCRVPMAGTDYSPRPYSYDDIDGDTELNEWALTDEDYEYKLPFMKQALDLTTQDLLIFASPWSPPAWMKTNGKFNGSGTLIPEMWQPWANYFVKFFEAYESELGIQLWGLTTQNEPPTGLDDSTNINACGWTPEDMRDWIKNNLGPTLGEANMRRLQVMVLDYTRQYLPDWPEPMTSDPECSQYVDGIAVHWYSDNWQGPEVLTEQHNQSPDKFILYTEASAGIGTSNPVALGAWDRGEQYITDIISDVNNWSTGWVDWNLVLDENGGPSWINTRLDSPVIVNPDTDEVYFQPTHTALGMFSRNVPPGSIRINCTNNYNSDNFKTAAFLNPDGTIAVVLANKTNRDINLALNDENGQVITRKLGPKSWETIVYKS